ncbi:MAG TPA: hypothetical protein VFP19_03265 [Candidatus Limnocylindrales bacterium]|nr:hypothetical protein [Candidatus Limnocylindrales bacterium]
MIQIELPCCDATIDLDPAAETVRCEACAIEHRFATDAAPDRRAEVTRELVLAVAA